MILSKLLTNLKALTLWIWISVFLYTSGKQLFLKCLLKNFEKIDMPVDGCLVKPCRYGKSFFDSLFKMLPGILINIY